MFFRFPAIGPVCAGLLFVALSASFGFAHGGPPLRLGVTVDPVVAAVARLVLVHLREEVGFAVDWREFRGEAELREALAGGKIDIAVGLTEADQAAAAVDCPRERLSELGAGLRRRWGAEAFLLDYPRERAGCLRPALIVSRTALEDLRFTILGREAGRMAATILQEDVEAVRAGAASGGERGATAAARAVLAAKAGR